MRHNDALRFPLVQMPSANSQRTPIAALHGFDRVWIDLPGWCIDVLRLIVDGEHCVAIVNIDTVFGPIPFAEHIHVVRGEIVSIRGYCDPRPMLAAAKTSA